jgi:hypothetical protein
MLKMSQAMGDEGLTELEIDSPPSPITILTCKNELTEL